MASALYVLSDPVGILKHMCISLYLKQCSMVNLTNNVYAQKSGNQIRAKYSQLYSD